MVYLGSHQELARLEGCTLAEIHRNQLELAPYPCPTKISLAHLVAMVDGTYTALKWPTVHVVTAQLTDGHSSILVGVHLDKGESAISLKSSLYDVSKVLEQRYKVVLRSVRGEIANVAGCLPRGCLLHNHVVALDTVGWEMVMTKRRCRRHAHCTHLLLLGDGRLTLLICPITTNRTRSKPLPIHRTQRLLCVLTLPEGNKTIAS